MNSLSRSVYLAFGALATIIMLTGCVESRTNSSLPFQPANGSVGQPLAANGYKLLYAFKGDPDADYPVGLTPFHGSLYGAALGGGEAGYGAVFEATTSGKEHVLYGFPGGSGGQGPSAALTALGGSFYGSTYRGGVGCNDNYGPGCGIIFEIDSSGKEHTVYSFKDDKTGGEHPDAALITLNGSLYGTTFGSHGSEKRCGSLGCGTVYTVSTSGKERIIYRFKGGTDGYWPLGLVALNGVLYGITQEGGNRGGSRCGCGTVFSVSPSGTEHVLYGFKGSPDGATPSSLIAVKGRLYGTTSYGGYSGCSQDGTEPCGTVFSLSTSGKEKVLYRFQDAKEGSIPDGIMSLNGVFYGTTATGGDGCGSSGCGTIFKLSTSGTEDVLYRFKGGTNGASPAGLVAVNGTLYGTTPDGGSGSGCIPNGCGTMFRVSP
jgi:uncharacterized repeat protein (TIGR03803 family)